jgi:hypothetical protein
MKGLSTILLFWICLLTVQPAVAMVCKSAQGKEHCCAKKCCKQKGNNPNKKQNSCCANGLCSLCAVCFCCFTATIEKSTIAFKRNSEKNNLQINKNRNFFSGYLTQCFHPPEIV